MPLHQINAVQPGRNITTRSVTLKLAAALIAGSLIPVATAATNSTPPPSLRITQISETSHPFKTLYCARQPVQYRFLGDALELIVNNESRILVPAVSASGARYVAPGEPATEFWGKGVLATITWSDQTLPVCAPAGTIIPPYKASGNEPFWSVSFDGWEATLAQPGKPLLTQDAQIIDTRANGQTLQAGTGPNALTLKVEDGLCIDNMSGMPHPQRAELQYQSSTWQGCGGNPNRLLQGAKWQVTQLGDTKTDEQARPELNFMPNNRIAGSTGCNRFFGEYTLTGEGMQIKNLGSTRMACSEKLMTQENTFLEQLQNARQISFDTPETLVIETAEGKILAVEN